MTPVKFQLTLISPSLILIKNGAALKDGEKYFESGISTGPGFRSDTNGFLAGH